MTISPGTALHFFSWLYELFLECLPTKKEETQEHVLE